MGLHVDMLGAREEGFGAVDGELFDDVDVFASAVPAFAGVAFGVFVGEAGALGFHDCAAGEVFGGDEFDAFKLALVLFLDGVENGAVHFGEGFACGGGAAVDFLDSRGVASAFKLGGEEGVHDGGGLVGCDIGRAHAEDVRIIMAAGGRGVGGVGDEGGADACMAVSGHAHADAGFAEEHAEIRLAGEDLLADEPGEIGVIYGVGGICAEVMHDVPFRGEGGVDGLFQVHPAVVCAEGDAGGVFG